MLLHDEEDERRDDVQRRDHDDEADCQRDGHLLEAERGEERLVHLGPVLRHVVRSEPIGNRRGNPRRRVDVVDAQLNQIDVRLAEEPLRHVEREEAVGGIELVEAEAEEAGDAQAARTRQQPRGRQRHGCGRGG